MRRYLEFASKSSAIVSTLIAVLVLFFLVFPNLPINGELLDVKSGYSFEVAMNSLAAYGPEGRTTYLWISLLLDTLFPVIYVTFFAGVIYRFRVSEGTWWLAYIPVFGGVWDLLENVQISLMLINYPDLTDTQVAWASTFTYLKHWIGFVYLGVTVVVFLITLTRKTFTRFRARDTSS
ncbi:MAG: hypothetical protein OXG15_08875 [Gammaproteobacteria bacterium]|nr:hypothetical protein [Gammaproteobacteria bacterium]